MTEEAYGFRSVTQKDLKRIAGWLAEPHVRRWWGDPARGLAEIREAMDSISTEAMIVEHGGRPIAYVQAYDPHLEDAHPYQDQPAGTLGIDFFVGEKDMLRQGHGSAILAALARLLFLEGAPRIITDPDPANRAATGAYAKAGFVVFGERASECGPALMMALDTTDSLEGN